MNRFNIARGLSIVAALVTGGCLAESSAPAPSGQTVEEFETARAVVVVREAQGGPFVTSDGLGAGVTHPAGTSFGPSPDPWIAGDTGGPSPDPWVPRARRAPSDGDPPPADGTSTSASAGNNTGSSNNK